jgi:CubicO group peptidase (beta-lactamase class C family)
MMRVIRILAGAVVASVLWAALVAFGAREGWLRSLPAPRGDIEAFYQAEKSKIIAQSKGNVALALLQHGAVVREYFASRGKPVDRNTLFQVASLSKWLTAWGVMTLVEQRKIDLDAPVGRYLTRWHLPQGQFDNNEVTIRRLLSHTAGLTDGLGYKGFAPGQKVPTVDAELRHIGDPMPGRSGVVAVGVRPGSEFNYSGGGFLILQLLIEEVSHEPFNAYMRSKVLLPLGMTESTYVDPDSVHLADFFDEQGGRAIHYKFAAVAAASLYTSTHDMAHFLESQIPGPHGEAIGRGVLKPSTIFLMRHPEASLYVLPVWGLGTILYAPNGAGAYVVGHDGNNYPAISTTARLNPANGDGIVMFDSGNGQLASEIGGDWTYWQTGTADIGDLVIFEAARIVMVIGAGIFLIVLGTGILLWRSRTPRA